MFLPRINNQIDCHSNPKFCVRPFTRDFARVTPLSLKFLSKLWNPGKMPRKFQKNYIGQFIIVAEQHPRQVLGLQID